MRIVLRGVSAPARAGAAEAAQGALSKIQPETVVASVDLGSNTFHLLIARQTRQGLVVDQHIKQTTRLAANLVADGAIGGAARERALDCLDDFGSRLGDVEPHAVRAVGTNAFRIASNTAEIISAAERRLGHPVETVSGTEEARLIYLGVSAALSSDTQRLVADIGGGSTELIIGSGHTPLQLESLPIGCVALTERYFSGGALDTHCLQRAEIEARRQVEPLAFAFHERGWDEVVGSSGTARAISAIARGAGWTDGTITPLVLDQLATTMASAGELSKLRLPGLADAQRAVLPGGLAIMRALFAALGIERMRAVEGALRDGLLHESVARLNGHDVRGDSMRGLAERCDVVLGHGVRVEKVARMLHRQVGPAWGLEAPEFGDWLRWASWLHECGRHIACDGYHQHGGYIVEHAELAGCSRQDQQHVAALIACHRCRLALNRFEGLRAGLLHLCLLLRLAVVLCRSRADLEAAGMSFSGGLDAVTLEFTTGWLAVRPLIAADLEEEAAFWREAGVQLDVR